MNFDTEIDLYAMAGDDVKALFILAHSLTAAENSESPDVEAMLGCCATPGTDRDAAALRFNCLTFPTLLTEWDNERTYGGGNVAEYTDAILSELFKLRRGVYPCQDCMTTAYTLQMLKPRHESWMDCAEHHAKREWAL